MNRLHVGRASGKLGRVDRADPAGEGNTVTDALTLLSDVRCERRSVALQMLAPGVLADRVTTEADAHGALVADTLCDAIEVVEEIVRSTARASIRPR